MQTLKERPILLAVSIILFAATAVALVTIINATTGSTTLEAERSSADETITVKEDPSASGGKFIAFADKSTPDPDPDPGPGPDPPKLPPSDGIPTMQGVTSNGLKIQNETTLETGSFQSEANNKILVWIMAVMAPDDLASPQNIGVSGHGTNFELITTVVKPDNVVGSRKLYLYSGTPSSNSSGTLSLNLGQSYSSSRFSWSVVTTNAQSITVDGKDTVGNITGQHTANFSTTDQDALYVAGYGIGTGMSISDDPQSNDSISGASTRGIAYSQWSTSPVSSMTASWGDRAHAFSVSLLLK